MLVCAKCRFENPNTNKFCQECGTSLSQNTCPACGSLVPFDVLHCQDCGTIAGVVWWAIIVEDQRCDSAAQLEWSNDAAGVATGDVYLDARCRYQLLEFLPPADASTHERQVRVLDCQPFQLSLLEALTVKVGAFGGSDRSESETDDLAGGLAGGLGGISSMQALAVPTVGQPYLSLRSSLFQAVPHIHDAWQQEGRQIVLLEDRSELPLLMDVWEDADLALSPIQLLQWLYDLVDLWDALEPWHYQQSLLEIANLRVDAEQALCLQRLYADPSEPPTLPMLGQLWQSLFVQSQRTQFAEIALLIADVETGNLATTDAVRSRIETIAHDFQVDQPAPDANPIEEMTMPDSVSLSAATEFTDTALSSPTATTRLEVPVQTVTASLEDDNESDNDPTVVLPMQLFSLEDVGRTDIGRQRQHNEDYFGIETQVVKIEGPSGKTVHVRNLYVLCDGMGGQADGEVASAMAVETLRKFFKEKWQAAPFSEGQPNLPNVDTMTEAVQLANKAIFDVNQQNARSGSGRMGTTLVLALVQDTEVAIAHVGDSRLYRYTRKRGLEQLTIDHEVGQREIQRGVESEIAYARPDAYQLTQALGPRDEHFVKPDVQYLELNEDALLLLCSDGLTDNELLETHCKTHVEPLLSSQTNLEQGVNQLIDLANKFNGHDNITAIVIRAKVRPNLAHLR